MRFGKRCLEGVFEMLLERCGFEHLWRRKYDLGVIIERSWKVNGSFARYWISKFGGGFKVFYFQGYCEMMVIFRDGVK